MKQQPISREAEALDALLDRQPYPASDLSDEESRLAAQIRELAGVSLPGEARFYQQLGQELSDAAQKHSRRLFLAWPAAATGVLSGVALLALLLAGALFLIKLLGESQPTNLQPAGGATATMSVTATQAANTSTPAAIATAVETTEPLDGLVLTTGLPDLPINASLMYQVQSGEPLNAHSAQAMAARLGVDGPVYQMKGENGLNTYQVVNRKSSVYFYGASTGQFTYSASYSPAGWEGMEALPFDRQAQIAEQWLNERGLLGFPYQIAPCQTNPACVAFIQILEEGMLYEDNPYSARIHVEVSASGKVLSVFYRPVMTEVSGSLAILPAAQVWETLQNRQLSPRIFFQTLDFTNQRSLRTWKPVYQTGERADVYGYVITHQPVDPTQPGFVEVNGLALHGSPEQYGQIPMRSFLHVWGTYQVDEQGQDWLELQGWELTPANEEHQKGILVRENGGLLFKNEDSELFLLPSLPVDVPEGVNISVSGARISSNEIGWRFIQTEIEVDNNLRLGSLPFPGMPLEPEALMPALPQTGFQPGERIMIQGELNSSIREYPDGQQEITNHLNVVPQSEGGPYWTARLVGDGTQGLETYTHLPVIVEGTYGHEQNEVVIIVDRYELVWPEVRIETWFGKIDEKAFDGQNVFVLTDDSGQEWVLSSSTRYPQTLAQFGWDPGTEIVIEGYPVQEEPTHFGGLPVLLDLAGVMLDHKGNTRETYQPYLNKPQVEKVQQERLGEIPPGLVEQVDLVYHAQTFQGGDFPGEDLLRLLLPYWRFSGQLADGRSFEILALAAKDTGSQ